jgi:excisionase family DNA binding protein
MEKLFTQQEFADYVSVHVNTVRKWVEQGLPHIKIAKVIRIDVDKALQWLCER